MIGLAILAMAMSDAGEEWLMDERLRRVNIGRARAFARYR
jgi:hypothetical protein